MKMSDEHYQALKDRIAVFADRLPAHKEALRTNPRVKDLHRRVRWDAFHAARIFDIYTYRQFDYTDAHIDTALRQIFKDLGISL